MSVTVVNGTPWELRPGMAVRMSAPNHMWAGVVLGLRARGRAEVVITDPGDSIHCPGQVVVVATRTLEPLRGAEAERQLAWAQAMGARPGPSAPQRPVPGEHGRQDMQALAEAIEDQRRQAAYDLDDAVAYLSEHITQAADTIALSIERTGDRRRRRWRGPR